MENASKALLMTGSILIGIILLSLAVYVYNIMTEAEKMKASTLTEEQLIKYNQEFLAYDKKLMYGTDVITVLNKAIDSNKKYDNNDDGMFDKDADDSMFIDISFTLIDDVSAVTTKYTWDRINKRYKSTTQKNTATGNSKYTYSFRAGNSYSISNNLEDIKNFLATSKEATAIKEPKNPVPEESYKITYTGFSDFKRMIFKCVKVERNDIGKICYMEFKQIKSSTYNTDE